jgi:hypothetical protein
MYWSFKITRYSFNKTNKPKRMCKAILETLEKIYEPFWRIRGLRERAPPFTVKSSMELNYTTREKIRWAERRGARVPHEECPALSWLVDIRSVRLWWAGGGSEHVSAGIFLNGQCYQNWVELGLNQCCHTFYLRKVFWAAIASRICSLIILKNRVKISLILH